MSVEFDAPLFHEFVIRLHRPVEEIVAVLEENHIQAGFVLNGFYPELQGSLLVCVTETKIDQDCEKYAAWMSRALLV